MFGANLPYDAWCGPCDDEDRNGMLRKRITT